MRATPLAALALAYLVFLVVLTPASFVATRLEASAPGRIEVTDANGTLWRGSARVRMTGPNATPVILDRVEWRFQPSRLAAASLAFSIKGTASALAGEMEAARGFSQWHLRDATLQGDASALGALFPVVAPWHPSGAVKVTAPNLAWDGGPLQGDMQVEWRGAATSLSEVRPIGSYRATWRSEAGGAGRLVITTLEGPLRITGEGKAALPGRIACSGEARAEGDTVKALEPLLDLLGPRRPDGARAIEWRY